MMFADTDRAFCEQDQAGDEIRHHRCRPKPIPMESAPATSVTFCRSIPIAARVSRDHRDNAGLTEDRRDRMLQAGIEAGARQEARAAASSARRASPGCR
jgi:hypothetical protein